MKTQTEYFQQLLEIEAERERQGRSLLESIGLGYLREPVEAGEYYCSPKNSRLFIIGGYDGLPFSFLMLPNVPIKVGPVVRPAQGSIIPMSLSARTCTNSCA